MFYSDLWCSQPPAMHSKVFPRLSPGFMCISELVDNRLLCNWGLLTVINTLFDLLPAVADVFEGCYIGSLISENCSQHALVYLMASTSVVATSIFANGGILLRQLQHSHRVFQLQKFLLQMNVGLYTLILWCLPVVFIPFSRQWILPNRKQYEQYSSCHCH